MLTQCDESNTLNVLFHEHVLCEDVKLWRGRPQMVQRGEIWIDVVRFSDTWEGVGQAIEIMERKRWRHFHNTWENKDGKFIYCWGFRRDLELCKHECTQFGSSVIIAALRAFQCSEEAMGDPSTTTTL